MNNPGYATLAVLMPGERKPRISFEDLPFSVGPDAIVLSSFKCDFYSQDYKYQGFFGAFVVPILFLDKPQNPGSPLTPSTKAAPHCLSARNDTVFLILIYYCNSHCAASQPIIAVFRVLHQRYSPILPTFMITR